MAKLSPSHEIIPHVIEGVAIHQRTRDSYIDARAFCNAAGKSFDEYTRWNGKFLDALSAEMGIPVRPNPGIPGFALIQSVRGGNNPFLRGTWVHPRVAIHLAQWLSIRFQVWVTGVVEDWERMRQLLRPTPTDWSKQVPDKLWQEIYRLKQWPWPGMQKNRYSVCGSIFVDLVYDRIEAPGLAQSIELAIPRLENGEHAVKMHQMLVAAVGAPALQRHIELLLMLMSRQATWGVFMFAVNQAMPKVRRRLPPPDGPSPDQGEFDFDS